MNDVPKQFSNRPAQLPKDLVRRLIGIHYDKVITLRHPVECADNARLIANEAVVHVGAEAHVHATFPIIESAPAQHHASQ